MNNQIGCVSPKYKVPFKIGATDQSFVERLLTQYSSSHSTSELLKKGPTEKQFVLQHFQGTNPVLYNANGWLQASREDAAVRAAAVQLQDSTLYISLIEK